jgi:hypothetical protein
MESCTPDAGCILATHYLNDPLDAAETPGGPLDTSDLFVYAQMLVQIDAGVGLTDFQTNTPNSCFDWCGSMINGHDYGGQSVELWPYVSYTALSGGFTHLSVVQVQNLAQAIATGDSTLCPDAGPPCE